MKRPRQSKVRGLGSSDPQPAPPLEISILSPADSITTQAGTPVQFSGHAQKAIPTSPDQAGTLLTSLPNTGWSYIGNGQWKSDAGDIETIDYYRPTDESFWQLGGQQSQSDTTACYLYSRAVEGVIVPMDKDFWICPVSASGSAFLPARPGFQPPDLSALIEWHSDVDGKFGEGPEASAMLSAGTHHITAQVSLGGVTQTSQPVTVTVEVQAVVPVTQPTKPGTGTAVIPAAMHTGQQPSSNWLWLLLLLLLVLSKEDKE